MACDFRFGIPMNVTVFLNR